MKRCMFLAVVAAAAIVAMGADENYASEAELPRIDALVFKSEGSHVYGQVLVPSAKFAGARPCVDSHISTFMKWCALMEQPMGTTPIVFPSRPRSSRHSMMMRWAMPWEQPGQ